jgi:hypothetical protein
MANRKPHFSHLACAAKQTHSQWREDFSLSIAKYNNSLPKITWTFYEIPLS